MASTKNNRLKLTNGERFLLERLRGGYTQALMAEYYHLSPSDYGKMERDQINAHRKAPALGKLHPHERCLILRRREGMTQAEVAVDLGCSRYWLNQMEHGVSPGDLIEYWAAA